MRRIARAATIEGGAWHPTRFKFYGIQNEVAVVDAAVDYDASNVDKEIGSRTTEVPGKPRKPQGVPLEMDRHKIGRQRLGSQRMRAQLLTLLVSMLTPFHLAPADDPVGVAPGPGVYDVIGSKAKQESDSGPPAPGAGEAGDAGQASSNSTPSKVRYVWRTPCGGGIGSAVTGAPVCPVNNCPQGEVQYRLWRIRRARRRRWALVCSGDGAPEAVPTAAAPPQVTEAMILRAFRRIPLPELRSQTQPDDKTLINFDTIFFTQAEPLTRQADPARTARTARSSRAGSSGCTGTGPPRPRRRQGRRTRRRTSCTAMPTRTARSRTGWS